MSPTLIIGIGIGLLLILGVGVAFLVGGREANVDDRLEEFVGTTGTLVMPEFEEQPSSLLGQDDHVADRVDKALSGRGFASKVQDRLSKADLKWRVIEYIGLQVLCVIGIGTFAFFYFERNIYIGLICSALGLLVPRIYTNTLASKRLRSFDNQLSDTLNLWVNSLRSGYSVLQGMEAIATELPPPVSVEFERVVQEVRLGLSLSQSLDNMMTRIPSEDLDLVVTAVNIQREVGGNLAEILAVISHTIRERVRIKGEIRTLTAQGRISGWVVGLLPVGLGLILYQLNPEYISELWVQEAPFIFDPWLPCGYLVIGLGLIMIGAGVFAIQKIVDICF